MGQSIRHNNQIVNLPFSRNTLERLQRMDESDLIKALDEIESDERLVAEMESIERNEPNATRTLSELKAELKENGVL